VNPLILCASTQYWEETWFRKQHFMSYLARRRAVGYIEPSHSIVRPAPENAPRTSRNGIFGMKVRRASESLWILTPPRGMPFWTRPLISDLQYRSYGSMLRREARRLGFDRVWLWMYNPLYVQALPTLAPERVILDLVDDLGAYAARDASRQNMQTCVERAIATSDLVIATSRTLVETYASHTRQKKIALVPNGVRGDWIGRVPGALPAAVRGLPHPRIGFVGALFGYLDYPLLRAAARAFPEGSLTLVGPIQDADAVDALRREPNVRVIGPVAQDSVPDYIASFDVCLAPFRAGAVRKSVNPLKVYEYLAIGRPVVATPLEALLDDPIAEQIRFAEGPDAFVHAIREALTMETPAAQASRREAVRPFAWESLSAQVASLLDEAEREWSRR
jgi:glycosyltransferase involved in cell wall biosynthesis